MTSPLDVSGWFFGEKLNGIVPFGCGNVMNGLRKSCCFGETVMPCEKSLDQKQSPTVTSLEFTQRSDEARAAVMPKICETFNFLKNK